MKLSIEKEFEKFLIDSGYKQFTPSGKPSTVYTYLKSIRRVCDWEGVTIEQLAKNIKDVLPKYDIGGEKEDFGKLSHSSVINALKRFSEFVSCYL